MRSLVNLIYVLTRTSPLPLQNLTVTPTPTLTFHLNSLPVTITSSSTPSLLLPFLCEAYNLLPPLTQPLTILVKAWLRNEASRITNGIPVNLPSESVHLMVVQCLVAMEERPRASKTLLQVSPGEARAGRGPGEARAGRESRARNERT